MFCEIGCVTWLWFIRESNSFRKPMVYSASFVFAQTRSKHLTCREEKYRNFWLISYLSVSKFPLNISTLSCWYLPHVTTLVALWTGQAEQSASTTGDGFAPASVRGHHITFPGKARKFIIYGKWLSGLKHAWRDTLKLMEDGESECHGLYIRKGFAEL